MASDCGSSSDSDLIEDSWSLKKRKKIASSLNYSDFKIDRNETEQHLLTLQSEKFEALKAKSSEIALRSSMRRQKTELRRSQKIVKKALRDPWIKAAVNANSSLPSGEEKNVKETKWDDIKPYLSVNEHLQGPILHGDCGPKTEVEYLIEDCIKDGDFEKAELLSDTLANREFAVKIAHAFEAKKYKEKKDIEREDAKKKQRNKIRWTFDAKERWQMKGNM